jgi:membrane protein YqaA with SNARE-associated domain
MGCQKNSQLRQEFSRVASYHHISSTSFINAALLLMQSEYGTTIGGLLIDNIAYADDIDVLANSTQEL